MSLTTLICSRNKLIELPQLPPSLKILWCSNNQLTVLPEIPISLNLLLCDNNPLIYPTTIIDLQEIRKIQAENLNYFLK
jgi:Leucine-rich repeat (LRR) protein